MTVVLLAGAGLLLALYWRNRLRPHPPAVQRLKLSVRESAHGFELSRSLGGRTLFRLQAATAVQLRLHQRAILHNVKIAVYHARTNQVDQIYGQNFEYLPESGLVSAPGLVHMDLGGQPGPSTGFQQPPAEERGNPIHIEAHNLSFNLHTGRGVSQGGVQFRYLQATGQADSAELSAHPNQAMLSGHVQLLWRRPGQPDLRIYAQQAQLSRRNFTIILSGQRGHPVRIVEQSAGGPSGTVRPASRRPPPATAAFAMIASFQAPQIVLYLHPDYSLDKLHFLGGLRGEYLSSVERMRLRAGSGWAWMRAVGNATQPPVGHAASARSKLSALTSGAAHLLPVRNDLASNSNLLPRQPVQIDRLSLVGGVKITRRLPGEIQTLAAQRLEAGFASGNHLRQMELLGSAELATQHAALKVSRRTAETKTPAPLPGAVQSASMPPPATPPGFTLPGLPFSGAEAAQGDWQLRAPRMHFDFGPGGAAPRSRARIAWMPSSRLRTVDAVAAGSPELPKLNFISPGRPRSSAQSANMHFQFGAGQRIAAARLEGGVNLASSLAGPRGMIPRRNTAQSLYLTFNSAGKLIEAREDGRVMLQQGAESARADQLRYVPGSGQLLLRAQPASQFSQGEVRVQAPQFRLASAELIATHTTGQIRAPGAVRIAIRPGAGMGLDFLPATGRAQPARAATGGEETINLAAGNMQAYQRTGWALFNHGVRLWQGPNLLTAERMVFDRKQQTLDAGGGVSSVFLLPPQKPGAIAKNPLALPGAQLKIGQTRTAQSISIRASSLHFAQPAHVARYQGSVRMSNGSAQLRSHQLYIDFSAGAHGKGSGPLRRVVAMGDVRLRSGTRRGQAERMIYDFEHNLITLRGGTPSIYDAELGFLTGRSLTFNPAEDSIKVESWSNARVYSTYYPQKQKP